MKVTMLTTVAGGSAYGSLTSGATYDLPYDYAKSLVGAGNASYKYPATAYSNPPDTVGPTAAAAVAAAIQTAQSKSLYYDLLTAFNAKRGKNPLELVPLTPSASAGAATDVQPYVEYAGTPTGPTSPTTYSYFSTTDLTLDTNSKYWNINGLPSSGNATNGFLTNYTGAKYVQVNSARTDASTYQNAVSGAIFSFYAKAPIVQLNVGNSSNPYRIAIDGRWATMGNTTQNGRWGLATGSFNKFTITHATSNWRRYDIECVQDHRVQNIVIGSADLIAPTAPYRRTVTLFGDSYLTTQIGGIANDILPQMLRHISGVNIIGMGIGASGYVAGNAATNSYRLADVALTLPDLVISTFGVNDSAQTAAAVQSAAVTTFAGLRAQGITCPILALCFGGTHDNDSGMQHVENGVAAAIAQLGDAKIKQIQTIQSTRKLLYGSAAVGQAGTVGNAFQYIGGDGSDFVHPNGTGGTEYLAREVWSYVLDVVNQAGW